VGKEQSRTGLLAAGCRLLAGSQQLAAGCRCRLPVAGPAAGCRLLAAVNATRRKRLDLA